MRNEVLPSGRIIDLNDSRVSGNLFPETLHDAGAGAVVGLEELKEIGALE